MDRTLGTNIDNNPPGDNMEDFLGHDNEYTAGETVEMFHYISNTWKKARVEEVDLGERDMLLHFEDGGEEWVSIDNDQIRRSSTEKILKKESNIPNIDFFDELRCNNRINSENVAICKISGNEKSINENKKVNEESDAPILSDKANAEFQKTCRDISDMAKINKHLNIDGTTANCDIDDCPSVKVRDNDGYKEKSFLQNKQTSSPGNIKTSKGGKSTNKVTILKLGRSSPFLKNRSKLTRYQKPFAKSLIDPSHQSANQFTKSKQSSPISNKNVNNLDDKLTPPLVGVIDSDKADNQTKSMGEAIQSQHQEQQQQQQDDKIIECVAKLPKLKIKLTRSACPDGSSWSNNTFVVTKGAGHDDVHNDNFNEPANDSYKHQKHDSHSYENNVSSSQCTNSYNDAINKQSDQVEDRIASSTVNTLAEPKNKRKCAGLKYAKMFGENYSKSTVHTSLKRPHSSKADEDETLKKVTIKQNIRKKIENKSNTNANRSFYEPSSSEVSPNVEPAKKRIKTLLPKVRLPDDRNSNVSVTNVNAQNTVPEQTTVVAMSDSSGFICPVKDCRKQFRRENLLMMHIKHYHTEYQKFLSSTPNVADLAYARTVGESISTTQSEFLQEILRLEKDRSKELIRKSSLQASNKNEEMSIPTVEIGSGKLKRLQEKMAADAIASEWTKSSTAPSSVVSALSSFSSSSSSPSSPKSVFSPAPPTKTQKSTPEMTKEEPPSSLSQANSILCSLLKMEPPLMLNTKSTYEKHVQKKLSIGGAASTKVPTNKNQKSAHLNSREIINCICGYADEDGLMIQCEICLCWQHGSCNNIEHEKDVPIDYVCITCRNPRRQRASKRYAYTNHWFTKGKLPRFKTSQTDLGLVNDREDYLKKTYNILGNVFELKEALYSLNIKTHIMSQNDHPKLYLWSKPWNEKKLEEEKRHLDSKKNSANGPVPEVAINTTVCRKNLSEHIEEEITKFDNCLKYLEQQVDEMDDSDTTDNDECLSSDHDDDEKDVKNTKRLLSSIMRTLDKVEN